MSAASSEHGRKKKFQRDKQRNDEDEDEDDSGRRYFVTRLENGTRTTNDRANTSTFNLDNNTYTGQFESRFTHIVHTRARYLIRYLTILSIRIEKREMIRSTKITHQRQIFRSTESPASISNLLLSRRLSRFVVVIFIRLVFRVVSKSV